MNDDTKKVVFDLTEIEIRKLSLLSKPSMKNQVTNVRYTGSRLFLNRITTNIGK